MTVALGMRKERGANIIRALDDFNCLATARNPANNRLEVIDKASRIALADKCEYAE
jgi:hypothetical protein